MNSTHVLFFGPDALSDLVLQSATDASLIVERVPTSADLISRIQSRAFSAVVVDHGLLGSAASEVIALARTIAVPVMLIFLVDHSTPLHEAVRLTKMGAYHVMDGQAGSTPFRRWWRWPR